MEEAGSTVMSDNAVTTIRDKILRVLKIYPRLSPSMLQIGLGTSLPPTIWRPILSQLIEDNVVRQEEVPSLGADGRNWNYQVLSLVNGQSQPSVD